MKNLVALRKEKGLTQAEVASILNISKQTYCHYEKGRYEPDISTLKKLADFFGCSVDYLIAHRTSDTDFLSKIANTQKNLNLKTLRKNANLSQTEIANKCGITLRSYQNYEGGYREMNYSLLKKMSDIFGCSVDYLIGHETQNVSHQNCFINSQRKENLKNLRKNKNLTQEELAKKLGLSQKIISNYEQGKTEPDFKTLIKMANFFGCSIDYLIGYETPNITHLDRFTPTQKEIIDLFPSLSEENSRFVKSYIYGLIDGKKSTIRLK